MSLEQYVSDQAVALLGMSEPSVVEYIIAEASHSHSSQELFRKLVGFGMEEADSKVHEFAHSLYSRIPKNKGKTSDDAYNYRKKRQREILQMENQNAKYELLLEPQQAERSSRLPPSDSKKRKERRKEHKRDILRRKHDDDEWQSDEYEEEEEISNTATNQEEKLSEKKQSPEANFTIKNNEEDERMHDLREREEFEERLRQRDLTTSTRDLVEDYSSKLSSEEVALRNLADDPDSRERLAAELRKKSRQHYLKPRAQQQLELLGREIQDEELLFADEQLTKREIFELEKKKELLRIAEERMNLNAQAAEYRMPEDYFTEQGKLDRRRKEAVLHQRYTDANDERQPATPFGAAEQAQWESQQISKALVYEDNMKAPTQEKQFDYVFDDSQKIDFLLESNMPGKSESGAEASAPVLSPAEIKAISMEESRKSLPVYKFKDDLLKAIEAYQVLLVVAETGSGKTTQLPQFLHDAGYTKNNKKICCTQPRRVAAMSVAARVANEMDVRLGQEVGYTIRFENNTSEKTVIKYLTDGMLLREFLTEPDLASYSVIIIDEAHERTLHTDILFGLVKDIARFRPDLKVLVSSATIDAAKFSSYFDEAPVFYIPGRRFPVDIYYTPQPEANYIQAAITTILQIHTTQQAGDILVFLTGQDEIEIMSENIQELCKILGKRIPEIILCPIYANLPSELQAKIFEPTPSGARKVVLATNIAETSITIDGVNYVIDSGFVKQNVYNPRTGMESLVSVPCSRASADQRAGRAGRVGPGKCFRLYTRWTYNNELDMVTSPEIQRTNLTNIVLLLKSLGINNLLDFDFMDSPPPETLMRSLELLYALGALNNRGELTKLGRQMAEFPTDPMLSKSLISSANYGCVEEVLSIIAMLGESASLFYRPKDRIMEADKSRMNFVQPGGDHLTLLRIWNEWVDTDFSYQWSRENFLQYKSLCRARDVRDQLANLCSRVEIELTSNSADSLMPIQKAITAGYFSNAARLDRTGDSYRTVKSNQTVYVHPSSTMVEKKPKIIIYYELVLTSKEYCRQVMQIQPEWLLEISPHYFKPENIEEMYKSKKRR
ncbi:ATP-dependent RNA helicase Cdc28 [Schizosaccharomyces osmophilus]|uniref:RNA helicase n=1 Tax=Schizosaccharomyces osmophilus TaxID=2545709 RepID=A0AAF0AVJ4_9SCHI|nr:ATP-dependent RNA helicase Cdc28 [Schizosaccharomyces osmophilus]WBW72065.1 ATP-dependent RNA helicase Cdc28 [Schizosaccharomyces osmophilus]